MHDAPFGAQQAAAFGFAHGVQGALLIPHFTLLWRQTSGNRFQQRGFTGAGFADDAEHFARPQLERDIAKTFSRRIEMGQVINCK